MSLRSCERRFEKYLDGLAEVMGHADRVGPLRDYCTGLMLPCARKSVEPMAAATAPGRTSAQHQSLLHFVGQGAWSDELGGSIFGIDIIYIDISLISKKLREGTI